MKTFQPNEVERNARMLGLIAFGLFVILPIFGILVVLPLAGPLANKQSLSALGIGGMAAIIVGSLATAAGIFYALRRWVFSNPVLVVDEEGMRVQGAYPVRSKINWNLKWLEIKRVERTGESQFEALNVWTSAPGAKPILLRYEPLDEIGRLVYQYRPEAGKTWEPQPLEEPAKDPITPPAGGIENLLRKHLERVKTAMNSQPGASELGKAAAYLLEGEPLAFVVSAIEQNTAEALAEKKPVEAARLFLGREGGHGNWIVVSVYPWLTPEEVRANLPGGYREKLVELDAKAAAIDIRPPSELKKRPLTWTNLVHWIYCTDGREAGVHLTYVPQASNPRTKRSFVLVARDLLTPEEKRKMGMRS